MASTELVKYEQHRSPVTRALTAPARGLKALSRMVFGTGPGLLWRWQPRTRFDYEREIGDGLGSSVLMAPILWIVRTFPEAPLQVLDKDSEVIENHPLVLKLRRPNPYYSGIALWMATLLSWVLDGNAYWIKVGNQAGTTDAHELWYAPHWSLHPKGDASNFITHYEYHVGGEVIRLEPAEVVHFRNGLDPRNPRKGLSPLGSLFREIFTDEEAANFAASLLRNVGVPGLVVSPDGTTGGDIDPDDAQATKEYVSENFGGDRRGEPLVMSGPTKVQQFGFSPQQMDLTALRRVPEERVTAILGLSAMVVGLGAGLERSTFSNMAEARVAAYESNIIPTQRLFAEEVRHQILIPDFLDGKDDGSEIGFDLSKVRVLQDDRNEEANRLATLYNAGLITRAAARAAIGEEVTPADEVFKNAIAFTLDPADMMPGDDAERLAPIDDDPVAGLEDDDADEKSRRGHKDMSGTNTPSAPDGASTRQKRTVQALERSGVRLRSAFATELETALDGLGRQAADVYDRQVKTKDQTADDETLAASIASQLDLPSWKERELTTLLETHYLRVADQTVDTLNTVLNLGVNLPDPVEKQIVADGGMRAGLIDIDDQTKDAIFRALTDARENGEGPIEAARRIRQYVPAGRFVNAGPKYRAQMIARSETKSAQNQSSLAAYRESGTVTKVMAFDGEGDPICAERDGVTFTLDAASDEQLAHPNCTLSWAPVVD